MFDEQGKMFMCDQLWRLIRDIQDGAVKVTKFEQENIVVDTTPNDAKAVEQALSGERRLLIAVVDPAVRFRPSEEVRTFMGIGVDRQYRR